MHRNGPGFSQVNESKSFMLCVCTCVFVVVVVGGDSRGGNGRTFRVPMMKKKSKGLRAFSHVGPFTLNKLPYSQRHSPSIPQNGILYRSADPSSM